MKLTSPHETTLSTLAVEIRHEVEQADADFQSAVAHAVRAGGLLIEAKGQLKHGQWLPWLGTNFPGSARSAQGYMRLAENAEDAQRVAHLGIKGALKQLAAAPKPRLSALEGEVQQGLARLRADLQSIHAQGGRAALGYASWREFIDAEFPPQQPAEVDGPLRAYLHALGESQEPTEDEDDPFAEVRILEANPPRREDFIDELRYLEARIDRALAIKRAAHRGTIAAAAGYTGNRQLAAAAHRTGTLGLLLADLEQQGRFDSNLELAYDAAHSEFLELLDDVREAG